MWEWRFFSRSPEALEPVSRAVLGEGSGFPAVLDGDGVERRTDAYLDLGRDGIGLKLRHYGHAEEERLELKVRTWARAGVECWDKILAAPLPVGPDELELVAGMVSSGLRDLLPFPRRAAEVVEFLEAEGHELEVMAKRRFQVWGDVTYELAEAVHQGVAYYSALIESPDREALLDAGRELGMLEGDWESLACRVDASVVMGYPEAVRRLMR